MGNIPKSPKGIALVEIAVAILIFTLVIIGAYSSYVYARKQIGLRKHYRVAVQLAAQKLEELKAAGYNDIEEGGTVENTSLEGFSYSRNTNTEDVGLYKKIQVNVNWQQMGRVHNVNLATFIAP